MSVGVAVEAFASDASEAFWHPDDIPEGIKAGEVSSDREEDTIRCVYVSMATQQIPEEGRRIFAAVGLDLPQFLQNLQLPLPP
jgi:hypothetical protein